MVAGWYFVTLPFAFAFAFALAFSLAFALSLTLTFALSLTFALQAVGLRFYGLTVKSMRNGLII